MSEENTNDSVIEAEFNWDNLEAQAADIDNLNQPVNAQNENAPEPIPEPTTGELLAEVIQITADIVAPNWQIQKEESEQLGAVYGALIDKYMPDAGLGKYGLEISAVLVTGIIIKGRAGIPLRKPKEKQKALNDSTETPEQSNTLKAKAVNHG